MASQLKNNLRTIVAITESLLFSGVIFGWANMVLILKNEEYFKDLCEESSGNTTSVLKASSDDDSKKCGKQDERLALVFTISVFAFNAGGFIGGSVLDRLGTRVVRLIAWWVLQLRQFLRAYALRYSLCAIDTYSYIIFSLILRCYNALHQLSLNERLLAGVREICISRNTLEFWLIFTSICDSQNDNIIFKCFCVAVLI